MNSVNRFLFLTLFLSVFFWSTSSTPDPDLWGHTKYGLDMLKNGGLLQTDIYSYTVPGRIWINHEWLSEIVFALIYKCSGFNGMLIFKIILGLLTLFFIYRIIALNTKHIFEKVVMFISISSFMSSYIIMLRPQNFSYLFAAVYVYIFNRVYINKSNKMPLGLLCVLPFTMVLWVNLHGGFLAGMGLLVLFLIGYCIENKCLDLKLLYTFIAVVVCTFVNPYTYMLYKYLYADLSVPRVVIVEWQSLDPRYIVQWIGVGFCVLVLVMSNKKKTFLQIILFFSTLYLGLRFIKFFPFFLILAGFLIPSFLEDLLRNQYKIIKVNPYPLSRTKKSILFFAFIVLTIAVFLKIAFEFGHPFILKKSDYPMDAVEYIKKNSVKGNMLVSFNWAQYAIWELYPNCKVFYDGRHRTVYPLSIEKEYFNFHYTKNEWDQALKMYPTDLVLWENDSPTVKLMELHQKWEKIYSDDTAVLFKRKDNYS